MPRTPLFRLLQRSYALARESARTGVPVDEVVGRAREARTLTRRGFLGGAATVAGLTLVGGPSRLLAQAGTRKSGEVLIVGAGLAGSRSRCCGR